MTKSLVIIKERPLLLRARGGGAGGRGGEGGAGGGAGRGVLEVE